MKSKLTILAITINIVIFSSVRMVNAGDIKGNVKVLGGKGVEYALIYIEKIEGRLFPLPNKNPVVDQIRMTFVPHVLPVLVGSTVAFPNSD